MIPASQTRHRWAGAASTLLLCATASCASPDYVSSPAISAPHLVPLVIHWRLVGILPHSEESFTEGLVFSGERLFESVGRYGESALIELDPSTGATLSRHPAPDSVAGAADRLFAEGIAARGGEIVQLTWKGGRALVWDARSKKVAKTLAYQGDGWGLCFDGQRFFRSDGSAHLRVHGAAGFASERSIPVTLGGAPIDMLNELECVDGQVYANVWRTPYVVRIDDRGTVTGILDLRPLVDDVAASGKESVLNGIAWQRASRRLYVTGKSWSKMYVIELLDQAGAPVVDQPR